MKNKKIETQSQYKFEKYCLDKIKSILNNDSLERDQQVLLITYVIGKYEEDHKKAVKI